MLEIGAPRRYGSDSSRLRFSRTGGGNWKEWDRFIDLDKRPAFHIGNICNTCSFFFERKDGANQSISVENIEGAVESGLTDLRDPIVEQIAAALPEALYQPLLLDLRLDLVQPLTPGDYFTDEQVQLWSIDGFWGLPHDCRCFYYRTPNYDLGSGAQLFEFVIPMFPPSWLDPDRVSHFQASVENGAHPTAVAISVLDVKGPAVWPPNNPAPTVTEHFCLAHYLLDGHHKINSACRSQLTARVISFLAVEQGIASSEDLARLLHALTQRAA